MHTYCCSNTNHRRIAVVRTVEARWKVPSCRTVVEQFAPVERSLHAKYRGDSPVCHLAVQAPPPKMRGSTVQQGTARNAPQQLLSFKAIVEYEQLH
jgi:hypothetical protein